MSAPARTTFWVEDVDGEVPTSVSGRHAALVRGLLRAAALTFRETITSGRLGWSDPLDGDDCEPSGDHCRARRHLEHPKLARFVALASANSASATKSGPGDAAYVAGAPARWGVTSDRVYRAR